MGKELVKIKGDNNNIILFLDDRAPFTEVIDVLSSTILEALPLLSSNSIIINLGERKDLHPLLDDIVQKFKRLNLNLNKIVIDFEQKTNNQKDRTIGLEKDLSSITLLRRTVRSGQKILSEGDVIVFGDINPGGEVGATGNVTVLGEVRGVVHAGTRGDVNAYIVAYNLKPLQLRIANYIIRGEDLLKKLKGDLIQKVKIIYIDNGEFKVTSDFSIVREVSNDS